ncbi:hypothetical protein BDV95DRAFT_501882 [Massariosphaeria phaeospora]|uniref:Uncharacterized protein n=1 Tax=Massariosphaeria phaeospora TaxID=100035 RepID=A0A7C8I123_9PLEO|nr:hypothetical protein BDV95DRAFT_501882 [Massariosphaeria phaeospora]
MDFRYTPPYSAPTTPEKEVASLPLTPPATVGTPSSMSSAQSTSATQHIPQNLTQAYVDANQPLKRLQQDLLVLTSFIDNETLHWRPSWFTQGQFASQHWTLHNPPNVVTECLPRTEFGRQVAKRRMREAGDPEPTYIKDWAHWARYCTLYGIPEDFLCEDQVRLMQLGLPRSEDGQLREPPNSVLYPEPQPLGQGRYVLDPKTYRMLPLKFHSVNVELDEVVVVDSTGALLVEKLEMFYFHDSQWSHYDGVGRQTDDKWYNGDPDAPKKYQGAGRRWSYIPWTTEQEASCMPRMIKLRLWNED